MDEIQSPCINICRFNNQTGLCEGCKRTMDEIENWPFYSDSEKLLVLEKIDIRKISILKGVEQK